MTISRLQNFWTIITKDKVTEIFCIINEFDKNLSAEFAKKLHLPSHNSDDKRYRNRKGILSESEIMTSFRRISQFQGVLFELDQRGDASGFSRRGFL